MNATTRFLSLAAASALAACSSAGTARTALPQTPAAGKSAQTAQTARATISIVVPLAGRTTAAKRTPSYVSPNTQSFGVTVVAHDGAPIDPTQQHTQYVNVASSAANCSSNGTVLTCTGTIDAPVGSDVFAVTASAKQRVRRYAFHESKRRGHHRRDVGQRRADDAQPVRCRRIGRDAANQRRARHAARSGQRAIVPRDGDGLRLFGRHDRRAGLVREPHRPRPRGSTRDAGINVALGDDGERAERRRDPLLDRIQCNRVRDREAIDERGLQGAASAAVCGRAFLPHPEPPYLWTAQAGRGNSGGSWATRSRGFTMPGTRTQRRGPASFSSASRKRCAPLRPTTRATCTSTIKREMTTRPESTRTHPARRSGTPPQRRRRAASFSRPICIHRRVRRESRASRARRRNRLRPARRVQFDERSRWSARRPATRRRFPIVHALLSRKNRHGNRRTVGCRSERPRLLRRSRRDAAHASLAHRGTDAAVDRARLRREQRQHGAVRYRRRRFEPARQERSRRQRRTIRPAPRPSPHIPTVP